MSTTLRESPLQVTACYSKCDQCGHVARCIQLTAVCRLMYIVVCLPCLSVAQQLALDYYYEN